MSTFKPDPSYDSLSPQTTKGDLAVYGAAGSTRFPAGADGTFIKYDSTQPLGVIAASPAGVALGWTMSNTSITLTSATDVLVCTNKGTTMGVTFPDALANQGRTITVIKQYGWGDSSGSSSIGYSGIVVLGGATTTAVFIDPNGANAATLRMFTANETYKFMGISNTWQIMDHRTACGGTYTPSLVNFGTSFGSANVFFNWSRVGECIRISGRWQNGTTAGAQAQVSIPPLYPGIALDTVKYGTSPVISGSVGRNSAAGTFYGAMATSSDYFVIFSQAGNLSPANGNAFSNSEQMTIDALAVVDGWKP